MALTKLGVAIQQGCENKAAKLGIKTYSIRQLARDTGITQSHITRAMHGQAQLSRNKINSISQTLESKEIFHAAGYLSPDELDEERPIVAA